MKHGRMKFLMATALAASISVAGISPAIAAPAKAGMSTVKAFVAPVVTISTLPNSTAANKTAKRLLRPTYKVGKGASLVSTRLAVRTAAGKVITPSATSVYVLPGSYRVTTTIRYTYKQNGKAVAKTVSKTQNLVIGVANPAPAMTVAVDVFNRLNALRLKKGLPAFKSSPAFNSVIANWQKSYYAGADPTRKVAGLDQYRGPIVAGGSYVYGAGVVAGLMNQAWFPPMLYNPAFNTLSVITPNVRGQKEANIFFARISVPGSAPATLPIPGPAVKPSAQTAADVFSRLNALRVKKGLPELKSDPAFTAYVAAGGSSVNSTEWPTRMSSSTTTGVGSSNVVNAADVVAELFGRGFLDLYDPRYNVLSVAVSSVKGESMIYIGLAVFTDPT